MEVQGQDKLIPKFVFVLTDNGADSTAKDVCLPKQAGALCSFGFIAKPVVRPSSQTSTHQYMYIGLKCILFECILLGVGCRVVNCQLLF